MNGALISWNVSWKIFAYDSSDDEDDAALFVHAHADIYLTIAADNVAALNYCDQIIDIM